MDKQKFLQVFSEALTPNTDRVKAATATLKSDYYPLPESLTTLLELLLSDQQSGLRQLAATQSRTLVPKHWKTLSKEEKDGYRQRLLQGTLHEEEQIVRHAAARVVTAIAKIDLENNEWLDVFDQLLGAASSNSAREREVGTYILFTSLEAIGEPMTRKNQDLMNVLSKTISDGESAEVRINTMLALSRLAIVLDPETDHDTVAALQEVIPQMVGVLKQAIDTGDEDRVTQSFECFQTLLGCDSAVLNKHFGDLVQFMVKVAAETSLDEDARTQALSFLMQCLRYRKLKMQSLKCGEQITKMCLEIATEMGDAAAQDEEDVTTPRSALILLDEMASSLPPSQVVVPLLHGLGPYVNSQDPDRRQGGLLALGMVVEGAPDFIATQLKDIFPLVLRLLEDDEVKVRGAALDCVGRIAEELPEDLGKEHQRLLPALVKHMDTAAKNLKGEEDKVNLNILKATCNSIEAVVDGLDPKDIKPYLPELVPRLRRLFSHPHLRTKGAAIGAVGSVGSASKDDFLPYFQDVMNDLQEYVEMKDSPDELDVRSMTIDAMGSMALAVGPKAFQRYVRPLMRATEEALHLEHPKLKETSFLFWAMMAKVYGDEFKPFLEGTVKALFECLDTEESDLEVDLGDEASDLAGKEITIGGKKIKISALSEDDFLDAAEIEDLDGEQLPDDSDDDWADVDVVSAVAQEKEIAVEVLGDILTHCTKDYVPYMEKTVETILPMCEHSYEGVQKASLSTLFRAYAAVWELQPESITKWKPGLPIQQQPSDQVRKLGEILMEPTLLMWEHEQDRAIVTEIGRSLSSTLKASGPSLISTPETLHAITQITLSIITKSHPCQKDFGADEDLISQDELSEYDWLTIDTAMDVICGLATALGPSFAELYKIFAKPILSYASGNEGFERATAVGVISECIKGMKDSVTPYTSTLLPLLLRRLTDEDPETKSNAAYAIGLLQEFSGDDKAVGSALPQILERLEPLLGTSEARLKDNAAGALARMIIKRPGKMPVEQVVGALLNILPLKDDYDENEPVWSCLVGLYSKGEPTIVSKTSQLMAIVAEILSTSSSSSSKDKDDDDDDDDDDNGDDQLDKETKEKVLQLVKFVAGKFPNEVGKYDVLKQVVSR